MNIDLKFQDWQLVLGNACVRQYDDRAQVLRVTGDLPEGWRWRLYVSVFGEAFFNAIPLAADADGALTAVLTRDDLAFGDTVYTLQLVGEREDVTRHTNPVRLYVGESVSGDGIWPEVPDSITAAQRAAESAAARADAAETAAGAAAARAETARTAAETAAESAADAADTAEATAQRVVHSAVRYDTAQTLSDAQKEQARLNIEAVSERTYDTLEMDVENVKTAAYAHIRDASSHVSAADRAAWNAKAEQSAVTALSARLDALVVLDEEVF